MTPQNIVIGGASGAMPPVLGWAAVTGEVAADALMLFLIIFAWTPPHFWALALYRKDDYAKAGVPMLPVTHGDKFTRLHVLLYTVILTAVTLLPFVDAHERRDLPRRGGRARRRVPVRTPCASTSPTATAWRSAHSATRSSISRRCSRRCSSITTSASPSERARGLCGRLVALRRCFACSRAAALGGCERAAEAPKFALTDVTGASFGKELELTDHNGKPRTLADFRGKVVDGVLRLHALPRCLPHDARRRWRR